METVFDVWKAFLLGGLLSVLAQILIDRTSLTPGRILVLYAVSGVVLGASGLYQPLEEIFGCGIRVPLIGFGGNVAKGVKEAVGENGFFGIFQGPLEAAAFGTSCTLFCSFLTALFFRSKPKKL